MGVRLHSMDSAQPVEHPQHPQVRDVVIAPGEVEQPAPIADGERVKIQRVPLASVRAIGCLVCHRLVSYFRIVHGRRSRPAQCYARPATLPGNERSPPARWA
jgi:hypothetical protein